MKKINVYRLENIQGGSAYWDGFCDTLTIAGFVIGIGTFGATAATAMSITGGVLGSVKCTSWFQ